MNSFLEFLVSFFLNTYAFDSSSIQGENQSLRKREPSARRPSLPKAQQAVRASRISTALETPSQTDGGSVRGGKKGSVLVISMMWALDSRRAFGLGALPGFPVASERECVSHSLRNATPKAGV